MTDTVQEELDLGDGMFVKRFRIVDLREQDINAQMMQPAKFDRLTENVRLRGQLEQLPYCHQPGGTGPAYIVSGHHRVRAARAAGNEWVWCLVDTWEMNRSEVRAKQIAHNELHGDPIAEVLAQMLSEVTDVEHLLMTGLDPDQLPTIPDADTKLQIPSVDLDYRTVTLVFLPEQMDRFDDLVRLVDGHSELVGMVDRPVFDRFSKAMSDYGRQMKIKSLNMTVDALVSAAVAAVEQSAEPSE